MSKQGRPWPQEITGTNVPVKRERTTSGTVYQAKVRAIEKVGLAKSVRDQSLRDAQSIATAVLYAEAKLGELIKAMPKRQEPVTESSTGRTLGSKSLLPEGITKKLSHYAQNLADHRGLIEKTIATNVLYAEAKLGELLKEIKPQYSMSSVEGSYRPQSPPCWLFPA